MNSGILFTALSGVLFGSVGYFGASLMELGLSVTDFLFWRFFLSACLLFPFSFFLFHSKINWKLLGQLLLLSGLFYGGSTLLYFEASRSIGTGLSMVIFFIHPVCVVGLSILMQQASPTRMLTLSLVVLVTGCALIAYGQGLQLEQNGIVLAIFSAIAYGIYVFGNKQISCAIPSPLASLIVCVGNTMMLSIYMYFSEKQLFIPFATWTWFYIVLFSLIATILPVLFLFKGLKSIPAYKASMLSALGPITTLIIGSLALKEEVTMLQLFGSGLVLGSSILIQFDKDGMVSDR